MPPTIAAGWRHPKRKLWMPSTSTDTPTPEREREPERGEREAGLGHGAPTGRAQKRAGTHTAAHPASASAHPRVAQASRGPVARNSGTAAATTSPHIAQPAAGGPVWNRSDLATGRGRAGTRARARRGRRPRST